MQGLETDWYQPFHRAKQTSGSLGLLSAVMPRMQGIITGGGRCSRRGARRSRHRSRYCAGPSALTATRVHGGHRHCYTSSRRTLFFKLSEMNYRHFGGASYPDRYARPANPSTSMNRSTFTRVNAIWIAYPLRWQEKWMSSNL